MKNIKHTSIHPFELEWYHSTKELLSPSSLLNGLLDYGLFSERVPPCFISVGLTSIVSDEMSKLMNESNNKKLQKKIAACSHDFIRYEALRDTNIPRHLGVPHPEAYAAQCFGIEKNWKEISEHCNKPNPPISRIYVRHVTGGRVFSMNYKGIERYELEEKEILWKAGAQYVVKADIASCFPSIYTHSIPWALHGKAIAKSNHTSVLSGNLLDQLTQSTRDRQTNGLIIGPHASNVISEIVLTAVDVELQKLGHEKLFRHIDDYTFYAKTHDEAERFIKDLGLTLRAYEMSLNDKKTQVLVLPRPSLESWIQRLNRFAFPDKEITFGSIRSYLDLALECVQKIGKSTPLNYAIKTLAGKKKQPRKLNERAKRLYIQEVMNLALAYPYLVPLLDKHVFDSYHCEGLDKRIAVFAQQLMHIGVTKLYPDTIAYAIYYALKYEIQLDIDDSILLEVVKLDDCLTNVLLFEYSNLYSIIEVINAINKRADEIKSADSREKDKNWLLIYQLWSIEELEGNNQKFLANLKKEKFEFLKIVYASLTQSEMSTFLNNSDSLQESY